MDDFRIRAAAFPEDSDLLRQMFLAYADGLGIDLGFQSFSEELAGLPGAYVPPQGAALLAESTAGNPIGCVALRPLGEDVCEMKRLYILPEARGFGVGRALCTALIAQACRLGYDRMVLDTLDDMTDALRLYRKMGFKPIPAYYQNPIPNVVYLGLDLTKG